MEGAPATRERDATFVSLKREIDSAHAYVVDALATSGALLLIAFVVVIAVGWPETPAFKPLLGPTITLLKIVIIIIALRAAAIALADSSQFRLLTRQYRAINNDRERVVVRADGVILGHAMVENPNDEDITAQDSAAGEQLLHERLMTWPDESDESLHKKN